MTADSDVWSMFSTLQVIRCIRMNEQQNDAQRVDEVIGMHERKRILENEKLR